jgi:hypothetical protein
MTWAPDMATLTETIASYRFDCCADEGACQIHCRGGINIQSRIKSPRHPGLDLTPGREGSVSDQAFLLAAEWTPEQVRGDGGLGKWPALTSVLP